MNTYFALMFFSLFTVSIIHAQANPFYVGASYLSVETDLLNETDNDSGKEFRAGFLFNENIAIEANYLDFGSLELPRFADAGGSIDSDGYAISIIGKYPFGRINLVGSIGYLWWEADGTLNTIAGPVKFNADDSDVMYGAGISFDVTPQFELKAQYQDAQDFNWGSVGINYYF